MSDPCCALCRHMTGICLSRGSCEHHKIAQAQDEANHQTRKTYNNPTQDKAIANVMRKQRRKE